MSLTPAEKENVLVFNEETRKYRIFCSSPLERTRMKKAGFKPYKVDAEGNEYYLVERNQVSFRAKSKPRQWTDEQRKAAAERLVKTRSNR